MTSMSEDDNGESHPRCGQSNKKSSDAQSWQQYIKGPSSSIVHPVRVVNTTGDVTDVENLLSRNSRVAQLRRNETYSQERGLKNKDHDVPSITLDFGVNVVGQIQVEFAWASDNSPGVTVAFSETLEFLSNRSDFTRSDNGDTITNGTDQFAVTETPYTWTDVRGCLYGDQVCADGLHGFRYMKISLDALDSDAPYTSAFGEIHISQVSLKWSALLGTPDSFTGWFECSDNLLNEYWFQGVYTNDMCIDVFREDDTDPRNSYSPTLEGKLVLYDGAKRDRDPYVGDLGVSGRTLYLSHDAAIAAKNVLSDLADHQRSDGWIPPASINNYTLNLFDYPLWWVVSTYDLLIYTGDTAFVQQYYSNLQKTLNVYYANWTDDKTGLLTKQDGYGDYAFLPRTGIVTYYNALYVHALRNGATIATLVGNLDDAADWTARAKSVSKAINVHLWDSSVGAYFDQLNSSTPTHAQDGNSIAILAGVASPAQARSILTWYGIAAAQPYGNAFYDSGAINADFATRVYAFISYFEIRARFEANMPASALEQIRRTFGWMATHDPFSTFWEGIGANGSMYEGGFTSAAHGWSTGVVPLLTNSVLGVEPTGPGFTTWFVRPSPGDVSWARGRVPTPLGVFDVKWSIPSSGGFSISVFAPEKTEGKVRVPVVDIPNAEHNTTNWNVYLDDEVVWSRNATGKVTTELVWEDGDMFVHVNVTGGVEHTVEVR